MSKQDQAAEDLVDTRQLANRIRKHAVTMTHLGMSSHVGSVLSIADILAVLYGRVMRYDNQNPDWENRDRFILSKGHAGAGVYAVLAECGFFSLETLETHYADGSNLSGHISHKDVPGVELSTGSLGHGLPVAAGMALAAKKQGRNHRVICLMSDGECDEGSNWEAILFIPHHQLDNLLVVVDYNKLQSIESVANTLELEPFIDKWRAFNWNVQEINGHNHLELEKALNSRVQGPLCVIAHTTKGKGVSFMENSVLWHYRSPQGDEYARAMHELESGPDA